MWPSTFSTRRHPGVRFFRGSMAGLYMPLSTPGVETDEQFMFLKSHKCTEGQGYYFSHPVVAEQAGRLIGAGTV